MAIKGVDPLARSVRAFLRREALLGEGDRVVVAFSGGADSTALLSVMATLARSGRPRLEVIAAHFDHRLRAGSRSDALAAGALARTLGVEFHGGRATSPPPARGSVEAWARTARYGFLARIAARCRATAVATAHTRDDRVETVLHRVLQGGNLAGLSGLPLRRPLAEGGAVEVVRPFHEVSRREVLAHLARAGLPHREDPTNGDGSNGRSRLRRDVLPVLRSRYPGVEEAMLRLEEAAGEARRALEREAARRPGGGDPLRLPRSAVEGLGTEGVRRSCRDPWTALGGSGREPAAAGIRRLVEALRLDDGRSRVVPLGQGIEARVDGQGIEFRRAAPPRRTGSAPPHA